MADGFVQVQPDSTGKKADTSELTVGANTVERQRLVLADDATAAALAKIKNAAPASTDYGLITRPLLYDANGNAIALGQAAKASSLPVVLASDQPNVPCVGPASRQNVTLYIEALAGAASEALISMNASTQFAAAAAATSFSVPAGKTLHLHTLIVAWVATTTTANTTRIRIRVNPSGAAVITSVIALTVRMGWESPTFIANEAEFNVIPIPEGIEVPSGGGVAFTHLEAAANGTLDITALGYLF